MLHLIFTEKDSRLKQVYYYCFQLNLTILAKGLLNRGDYSFDRSSNLQKRVSHNSSEIAYRTL